MKAKIILQVYSGLGNQQFEYAFARALSLKYDRELILDDSYFLKRYFYPKHDFGLYLFRLKEYNASHKSTSGIYREFIGILTRYRKLKILYQSIQKLLFFNKLFPILITQNNFSESLFANNNSIIISDYFQKYDIFEQYADLLRDDMRYTYPLTKDNQEYLKEINSYKTASVHIRRGDYLSAEQALQTFSQVSKNYYKSAIEYIQKKSNINKLVIFSNDLEWVKANLKFEIDCLYIENDGPDSQHQFLMTNCNHHVIANSTYSWWGAWLNPSKDKIVCVPKKWFNAIEKQNDIYIPNGWIRIEND